MTQNYFAIERKDQSLDHVYLRMINGDVAFEDIMDLSYDELKTYDKLDEFVTATMDSANVYFKSVDEQTIINLIGPDDVFIWGVFIGAGDEEGELKYLLVDWHKDGKNYRYKKD